MLFIEFLNYSLFLLTPIHSFDGLLSIYKLKSLSKISTDKFNKICILPTFGGDDNVLWAVAYPEFFVKGKPVDELSRLFDLWRNPEQLLKFFKDNLEDLRNSFWDGLSIEDAVLKVQKEAISFQAELRDFVLQDPGSRTMSLSSIFEQLDKHEFALKANSKNFRKGKPNFERPLLRLFAIEMEEGEHLVTGGAIKLSAKMDRPHLKHEIQNLIKVHDFLKSYRIYKLEEIIQIESND